MIRVLFLAILVLMIQGCMTIEKQPARYPVFREIKSIAVMPFHGNKGEELANEFESQLVNLEGAPGNSYQVATRSRADIQKLEQELRYQNSGATEQVLQLGRALQVTTVMVGDVETKAQNSYFTGTLTQCVKKKGLFGCAEQRSQQTPCTRLTVTTKVVPRLLDVESGRVIYSHVLTGSGTQETCSLGGYTTGTDPYSQAENQVIQEFAKDIAPYTTTVMKMP